MTNKDSILLSWTNVKGNRLRTSITVLIMALGIFALILIITAIKAASNSLTDSFATMGANAFSIRYKERNIRFGGGDGGGKASVGKKNNRARKSTTGIPISYDEAVLFKDRFQFPAAKVGLAMRGAMGIVVNNSRKKTSPEITSFGGDENYLELNGYKIQYGRNFTATEVNSGRNVCMLGQAVATRLFPDNTQKAIDAIVNVDHIPYRVIAVLEDKGSSAFFNSSKIVVLPLSAVRRMYATDNTSYNIAVMLPDVKGMDMAVGEATATFRPIRKLQVKDEDNFYIDKSDSIAETFLTNLEFLEKGTIGIAFITLLGSAIGLMNIMLVAVNERTKEIGLAKALGCTSADVRKQFLYESVFISLMGAAAGIVAGILIGNGVALLLKTGFVVPWGWVLAAIIVCTLVGLMAGLYPAHKASRLDPIVALRYE